MSVEPGRARAPFVATVLTTALVAGGSGAAGALLLDGRAAAPARPQGLPAAGTLPAAGGTLPAAGGTLPAAGSGGTNVAAIAAKVERSTVDITASGPNIGQDAGTGIIINRAGLVLTNNHVIEGSTQISAQVNGSGPIYAADVVGTAPALDIALLSLQGDAPWAPAAVAVSRQPAVGDPVIAIGNSLDLPGPETVTAGSISSIRRDVTIADPAAGSQEQLSGLLQTSAQISSGNSGGPLVDPHGEVIGITTASASSGGPGQATSNIGFAIPISSAMSVVHRIEAGKPSAAIFIGPPAATGLDLTSVACADGLSGCLPLGFGGFGQAPPGTLGIYQAPAEAGAVVSAIEQGCPAAGSGLGVGDVITRFAHKAIVSPEQVVAIVGTLKVGDAVAVRWVGQNGRHHQGQFKLVQGPNV